MTIYIKKGVNTGAIILSSDRGLCIGIATDVNQIEQLFDDVKKEMAESNSPSGSICLPFNTQFNPPKPLLFAFANAGVSITGSDKPDTLQYAIDKMERFEDQVERQFASYNDGLNEKLEIDSTVTISKKELFELRVAAAKLALLESGGVDNWEWYGESLNPENGESFGDIKDQIRDEIFGKAKVQNPKIRFSSEQILTTANFGAKIDGDFLVLPLEIEHIAKQCNIRHAAHLFGMITTFPTSFAVTFGWTDDEVKQATETLKQQLRGHLPDTLLDADPNQRPQKGMGAQAPADHPIQKGYIVPPRQP